MKYRVGIAEYSMFGDKLDPPSVMVLGHGIMDEMPRTIYEVEADSEYLAMDKALMEFYKEEE